MHVILQVIYGMIQQSGLWTIEIAPDKRPVELSLLREGLSTVSTGLNSGY
jgi:hypothetical protein